MGPIHLDESLVHWVNDGLMTLFFGGPHWPALVACTGAILANVEGVIVCFVLPEFRTDVGLLEHHSETLTGVGAG